MASLIGEWEEEEEIDQLEATFPTIKELEGWLLTGELDAQLQQRITVHHGDFTCEADTLSSHSSLYIIIYVIKDFGKYAHF